MARLHTHTQKCEYALALFMVSLKRFAFPNLNYIIILSVRYMRIERDACICPIEFFDVHKCSGGFSFGFYSFNVRKKKWVARFPDSITLAFHTVENLGRELVAVWVKVQDKIQPKHSVDANNKRKEWTQWIGSAMNRMKGNIWCQTREKRVAEKTKRKEEEEKNDKERVMNKRSKNEKTQLKIELTAMAIVY